MRRVRDHNALFGRTRPADLPINEVGTTSACSPQDKLIIFAPRMPELVQDTICAIYRHYSFLRVSAIETYQRVSFELTSAAALGHMFLL